MHILYDYEVCNIIEWNKCLFDGPVGTTFWCILYACKYVCILFYIYIFFIHIFIYSGWKIIFHRFGTKQNSVWFQINRKLIYEIWFRFMNQQDSETISQKQTKYFINYTYTKYIIQFLQALNKLNIFYGKNFQCLIKQKIIKVTAQK